MADDRSNAENWRKLVLSDVSDEDLSGPKIDRRTTLKLLSAAGLSGLAGCSSSDTGESTTDDPADSGDDDTDETTSEGSPQQGGDVTIGWGTDNMGSLDPHYSANPHSLNALPLVHNGVLKLTQGNEIVGDLAKDWDVIDGTRWEFNLQEDVKFHNGDDFTAEDMVESVRILIGREDSPHRGKTTSVLEDSLAAPDPNTFVFETEAPVAVMPAYLTTSPGRAFVSLHPEEVTNNPDEFRNFPVGTGPYRVTQNEQGSQIVLEAFEDYWETDDDGNQLPYLDTITIDLLPESTTIWSGMQSGDIHYTPQMSAEFVERAQNSEGYSVSLTNAGAWKSVCFLCEYPHERKEWASHAGGYPPEETTTVWEGEDLPTTDPDVRRALSMAIDRERLVEVGWLGFAEPAHYPWNPTMPWAQEAAEEVIDPESSSQYYRPERAEEILDEAGYTGDPRFSATLIAMPVRERAATVIQEMYSQIGVDVELQILQSSDWFTTSYNFTTMMDAYTGGLDIAPGQTVNNQLHTPNKEGWGAWSKNIYGSERFDEAIEAAAEATSEDERVELLKEMTQILDEEAPYAWTVFPSTPAVSASSLNDVHSPAGLVDFTYAWLDE